MVIQRLQNDCRVCVLPPEYLMLSVNVTEISEVQLACHSVCNMCAEAVASSDQAQAPMCVAQRDCCAIVLRSAEVRVGRAGLVGKF